MYTLILVFALLGATPAVTTQTVGTYQTLERCEGAAEITQKALVANETRYAVEVYCLPSGDKR